MSCFSMRENKSGKNPHDWLPLPWEDEEDEDSEPPLSEEDRQELVDLIDSENARLLAEEAKSGKG